MCSKILETEYFKDSERGSEHTLSLAEYESFFMAGVILCDKAETKS